jgi:alkanesulfonate monooxygenase SsuD/methylene tetrahydromethanopterin reductase-like flavin-dependent oxidoreductase (luciferase family)
MRLSVDALVDRAQAAEAAGFVGMAGMDHLAPPLAIDQPMYEAMTTATWLAARTERLVQGHLVLCDAFRHPVVLARQAVSLDHMSGGRFELGLGWGSVVEEFHSYGISPVTPPERVDRMRETLEVLELLWSGEPFDYEGTWFTVTAGQQLPVPLTRIPVVIGGVGKKTMALVAKHADWWNVPIHHLDKLDERRADAGTARVSTQSMVVFVPSEAERDEVTEKARRRFSGWGSGLVVGTADELVDHFAGAAAAGVERFYVWFADFAPPATLAAFGAGVIGNV